MTLNSNAKVAGFAILVYLAAGISSMAVAANAAALLAVVQSFCALLLGVTLWSPMLVFELTLAAWLITKGIARPTTFAATQRAEQSAI